MLVNVCNSILIASICVLVFRDKIELDFLVSIITIEGTISMYIRIAYVIMLYFHAPYFFFAVKEIILVLYDEILNKSLSTHLE